jgi:VanZ family protein
MAETSRFIGPLLHFLFPSASAETLVALHGYIRKSAHFTGYAILAFLTIRAVTDSSVQAFRNFRFVIAFILVATVAVLDEFNQSLNPSRTGSVLDILLDVSGGVAMILILWLAKWPRRSTNQKLSTTDRYET